MSNTEPCIHWYNEDIPERGRNVATYCLGDDGCSFCFWFHSDLDAFVWGFGLVTCVVEGICCAFHVTVPCHVCHMG